MILVFRGDPSELARGGALSRQSITMEGVTFVMGEPRDASALSPRLQAKLRNNNHFEVVADIEGEAIDVTPAAAGAAEADEAAEAPASSAPGKASRIKSPAE
jgi:hypothetical protein